MVLVVVAEDTVLEEQANSPHTPILDLEIMDIDQQVVTLVEAVGLALPVLEEAVAAVGSIISIVRLEQIETLHMVVLVEIWVATLQDLALQAILVLEEMAAADLTLGVRPETALLAEEAVVELPS